MAFMDFLLGEDPGEKQEKYLRANQARAERGIQRGIGNIPQYFQQYLGLMAPSMNTAISGMETAMAQNTRSQQAALARMLGSGGLIYNQAAGQASRSGAILAGRTLRQQANMDVLDRAMRTGLTEATSLANVYSGPAPSYQGGRGFLNVASTLAAGAGQLMTGIGLMQGGGMPQTTAIGAGMWNPSMPAPSVGLPRAPVGPIYD